MGRAGRWTAAGLVTAAAFAAATWVSGVFLLTRLLPSPGTRWPVAFSIGAAAAAFTGLWGQSWATGSGAERNRSVPLEQLAPHEQREREARDRLRQYLGRRDRLRRMDETSALALGVHPAIDLPRPPGSALHADTNSLGRLRRRFLLRPQRGRPSDTLTLDRDLPTFVGRDRGTEIANWMRGAREDGGFLVLVGDSSFGKTRLLYETARAELPDFAVLAPNLGDGDLVNSIAEATFPLKLIVWLDELQRFLDGPYLTPGSTPIKADAVRHLLDAPTPVVVLGATWREHATQLSATEPDRPGLPGQPRYPGAADILSPRRFRVHQVTLTTFSGTEREAAAKLSSDDPRLAEALADRHYNVTEVLAGAPQLVARYEQASEEQEAVLNAAIDARRLGIQAPLADALLRAAARGYLSTLHPDDTWFPAALTELTWHDRPQDHATAPLIPVPSQEKDKILGYTVPHYLLQHFTRQRRRLSPVTWQALVDHTRNDYDAARLAIHADRRLLYCYAEPLYRRLADDAGDTYAAHRLADLLVNRNGPADEIIDAFQILIGAGHSYQEKIYVNDAACLSIVRRLDQQGRDEVATAVRRAWADVGDRAAAEDWAWTLVRQDRIDQARQISQTVVEFGQEHIVESWFRRLLAQDRVDQAVIVLRAFIDAGGIRTARHSHSLDGWLSSNCRSRTERSAALYPGDPSGGREYVVEGWFDQLAQQGRVGDAMAILRAVADAGGFQSAETLADLLAEEGNIEELRARADAAERERRARPDDWFGDRLADLLADQGDIDELRARADGSSWRAAVHLADLLVDRGDVEELRARADNGDEAASQTLAHQLINLGDIEGLRARADDGDKYARERLADLLAHQGRLDEAITIARALATDDGPIAINFLCSLLQQQGNTQEAISLRRARADAGDKWAAADWAQLMIEQDRTDEAARIAMALAETNQERIASEWCLRLAEQGRTDDELTVLRALTEIGDSWAADRLVERLIALNRAEEAIGVLRARAHADTSGEVTYRLAELLVQQDHLDELQARADAGDVNAAARLADLLAEQGDIAGLRARAKADNGESASYRLADLLIEQGKIEELRDRADEGDDPAAHRLAALFAGQGRLDELRARADVDDFWAAERLTFLLSRDGRLDELWHEVDAGTTDAGKHLIDLLRRTGETERAERIRDFGLNPDGSIR